MDSSIDATFRRAAAELERRCDRVVAAALVRLREELPSWFVSSPDLWRLIEDGGRPSVAGELDALRREALPEELPEIDAWGARLAARLGVSLHWHLHLHRVGHWAQWECWHEVVEELGLPAEQRRELLRRGSEFFFAYVSRISQYASDAYMAERELTVRSHEQRRVQAVRRALEGEAIDDRDLDYPLELSHIGVVAVGDEGAAAVRDLAARLNRRALVVSLTEGSWWGWLGAREGLGSDDRRALAALRLRDDVRLAVGREAAGREGFRRTHAEAVLAQRLGAAADRAVVHFDDVALEALAGPDPDEAERFVAHELHGLDDDSERSVRLRETLTAWFAAGQNAAATAAALGVHEQTVAARLRAVEERTGRSPAARRAELETALRLRRLARGR